MTFADTIRTSRAVIGAVAAIIISVAALAAILAAIAAAAGLMPWLRVAAALGETPLPWAGPALQLGLTLVLLAIAATVPAMLRVARLEASHRSFALGMEDVARAYHLSHAADRAGAFRLRHEFDAVRERIAHLREHPDLAGMEPQILELAAQMSTQSRRLAETYSDDAIDRARRFLQQRQEEVERTREIVGRAHHSAREIRRWTSAVSAEEEAVETEIARLETELGETLPQLGFVRHAEGTNVVRMPATAAE